MEDEVFRSTCRGSIQIQNSKQVCAETKTLGYRCFGFMIRDVSGSWIERDNWVTQAGYLDLDLNIWEL